MVSRKLLVGGMALVLAAVNLARGQEPDQTSDQTLIDGLRSRTDEDRAAALNDIWAIGPENVSPAVRDALIEQLERVNALVADSKRQGFQLEALEAPEFVSELHRVVAALGDPRTIPVLAGALGSFTLIAQLTDLGEQAAPAVLDVVTDANSHYTSVDDGLRILRMMVEARATHPLSAQTMTRIGDAAEQRLAGQQYFTTLWYAIDLAAVLDDPALRQTLQRLSESAVEVEGRGVSDPRLIQQTQERAKERLAGVPARPQRDDLRKK